MPPLVIIMVNMKYTTIIILCRDWLSEMYIVLSVIRPCNSNKRQEQIAMYTHYSWVLSHANNYYHASSRMSPSSLLAWSLTDVQARRMSIHRAVCWREGGSSAQSVDVFGNCMCSWWTFHNGWLKTWGQWL